MDSWNKFIPGGPDAPPHDHWNPLAWRRGTGVPAGGRRRRLRVAHCAHQLGMALGLGILVAVSAPDGALKGPSVITKRVGTAITGSAVLLALAVLIAAVVILPVERIRAAPASIPTPPEPAPRTWPGGSAHMSCVSPAATRAAAACRRSLPVVTCPSWISRYTT